MRAISCIDGMYFFKEDIQFILPVDKAVDKVNRKEAKTILYFYNSDMEIFIDHEPKIVIQMLNFGVLSQSL